MDTRAACVIGFIAVALLACRGDPDRVDREALGPPPTDSVGRPTDVVEVPVLERVEAACRAIAEANTRVLEELAAKGRAWKGPDGEPPMPPLGARDFPGCVHGRDGGAWAIAVERGEVLPEGGPWTGRTQYEYAVAIVHVAPSGTTRRVVPVGLDEPRRARSGDTSAVPRVDDVQDFDDDARAEAVVRWTAFNGDFGERWLEIYRAGPAAPSRWPDAAVSITEVRDVDGDGRLDLLDDRAFEASDRSSLAPAPTITAMMHVLPGGRFSTTDEAVRAHYRESCGGKRVDLDALQRGVESAVLLRRATCAWLWGVPGSAIAAKLRTVAGEDGAYMGPWDDARTPPVTLP